MTSENRNPLHAHPLGTLPREDLDFITELVLRSGSLKDVAAAYGVSYPTIRSRLDRIIQRLQDAVDGRPADPVADLLAGLVERGELSVSGARRILDTCRSTAAASPQSGIRTSTGTNGGPAGDGSAITNGGAS